MDGSKSKKVAMRASATRGVAKAAAQSLDPKEVSRRIDEAIASLGDWRGEKMAEIRKLIHEVDPEVIEDWKWMGTPVWSHERMYALANAHKNKVKLTFHHGAQLLDPKKALQCGLEREEVAGDRFSQGRCDRQDRAQGVVARGDRVQHRALCRKEQRVAQHLAQIDPLRVQASRIAQSNLVRAVQSFLAALA